MILNDISKAEARVIELLRELRPFEYIQIKKDQNGRPDYFIVVREQKIVINDI